MTGFEMFDISSWIDANGLLVRAAERAKGSIKSAVKRKLANSIVASIAVGTSASAMASAPAVMRAPVVAQAATPARAATPIVASGAESVDSATPEYWATLMSKMQAWQPIVESSVVSLEPLD